MAKRAEAKKPIETKKETVESLSEKVQNAKSIAFVDYRGLTVNQISDLRDKIRKVGGEVVVAKNTLLKRALLTKNFDLPEGDQTLTGPTAAVFAYEDEVGPVKAVADSNKLLGLPSLKFGFLGHDLLDSSTLDNLAKLPSREQLHAKVVGAISSPLYGMVSVLSANIRNLVSVLNQAAKKAA